MNHEFVRKMMEAKRLEYEAIKEIIPDHLKDKMEECKRELIRSVGKCAMNNWSDIQSWESDKRKKESQKRANESEEGSSSKTGNKTLHKVPIEFK
jgi:glutamyl-tRNA reductase